MNTEELERNLSYFCGSEDYYRHWLPGIAYTDGVKFLADEVGAYWLIDAIASYQGYRRMQCEEFQVWRLNTHNDHTATLTCDDGNDHILVTQEIPHTDFPLEGMKLYLQFGSLDGRNPAKIIMLPSEY